MTLQNLNMMTDDVPLKLYATRLYERINESVILKCADVSVGDWTPIENDCHGNATNFCEHQKDYKPARGWLYFDYGGLTDRVQFLAHSAIQAPDGTLYDITPSSASQQYPFIMAEESEEDYARLVEGEGINSISYLK